MNIAAILIIIFGLITLMMCAICFLRAKDAYILIHIIKIANFYAVPLILFGIEINYFSITSLIKILAIIIMNILIANLLCHLIARRVMINKAVKDVEVRKS